MTRSDDERVGLASAAVLVQQAAESAVQRAAESAESLRSAREASNAICSCEGRLVNFYVEPNEGARAVACSVCTDRPSCSVCRGVGVIERRVAPVSGAPVNPEHVGLAYEQVLDCPQCMTPHRIVERWKGAGVTRRHAMAELDPEIDFHRTVGRWADRWEIGGVGLYIHGEPDVGKTYAAIAGLKRVLLGPHRPPRVRYVSLRSLMTRISAAMDRSAPISDLTEPLIGATILVVDEVQATSAWELTNLTRLVDERYDHNRTTVFVSNHKPIDLQRSLNRLAEHAGDRLLGRIRERCAEVHAQGPSRRPWAQL